jgi:hypothetical protein
MLYLVQPLMVKSPGICKLSIQPICPPVLNCPLKK